MLNVTEAKAKTKCFFYYYYFKISTQVVVLRHLFTKQTKTKKEKRLSRFS